MVVLTLPYVSVMVRQSIVLVTIMNISIPFPLKVSFLACALFIVLTCFILDEQRILVEYSEGKSYPRCPDDPTDTFMTLNCGPENVWDYSGNTGNASSHIVVMEPDAAGACLVCLSVFRHNTVNLVLSVWYSAKTLVVLELMCIFDV